MTTAVCESPRAVVPPPPGARKPPKAPAPMVCGDCDGTAPDPDLEAPCRCHGTGVAALAWQMPKTRTCPWRPIFYQPSSGSTGRLRIETAARSHLDADVEHYDVAEVECEEPGHQFVCAKANEPGTHYDLRIGPSGVSCDCPGNSYLASAKANQRAYEAGEETFPTYGCKHADALVALLLGGWFDL